MDEIKIGKEIEKEMGKEEEKKIENALQEEDKGEGRSILIMMAVIFGIFVISFGSFQAYNHFTGAEVVDVDGLHKDNLEGDLDAEEGYLYEGYSFVFVDGLWWTEMKKREGVLLKVPLHFGPREVEEVIVEGRLSPNFNMGDDVYIVVDPEFSNQYYTLAMSEINFNAVKGIERRPVAACSKENAICEDREILNCEDNKGKPVIELKYGGEPKVELKGTCILISGEDYGIVKAADRLIWQWYGVMN